MVARFKSFWGAALDCYAGDDRDVKICWVNFMRFAFRGLSKRVDEMYFGTKLDLTSPSFGFRATSLWGVQSDMQSLLLAVSDLKVLGCFCNTSVASKNKHFLRREVAWQLYPNIFQTPACMWHQFQSKKALVARC